MANESLVGMKVAILVDDGFEQIEPRKALDRAGAETSVVSPKNDRVRGLRRLGKGPSPIRARLGCSILLRVEYRGTLILAGGFDRDRRAARIRAALQARSQPALRA